MQHTFKALFAFTVLIAPGLGAATADTNTPQQAVTSQVEQSQGLTVGLEQSRPGIQKKSGVAESQALHFLDQSFPVGIPRSAEAGLGIVWHYRVILRNTSMQDKN